MPERSNVTVGDIAADEASSLDLAPGSLFVSLAGQVLRAGHAVRFGAQGHSMRPTICDGDAVTVGPLDAAGLREGDIILYQRQQRPIVHRVVTMRGNAAGDLEVVTRGDGKAADDAPIGLAQVMGIVVAIERGPRPTGLRALAQWLRTWRRSAS